MPPEAADIVIRFSMALAASAMVGWERERTRHAAGLRTHMLVCVGSTLVALTSLQAYPADAARISAGIVTGIGFLGAGTIFRDKNRVRGLTTAASLWTIAGIGLAIGSGSYFIAGTATVATLLTLELPSIIRAISRRHRQPKK